MRMVLMALAFVFVMASVAMATEYMPGSTYGQVSPDRVQAEREDTELVVPETAIYSPEGRYGFYQVHEQCCPDRVLAERTKAAAKDTAYLSNTPSDRYPMWGCCEQVSPDRVLCERCGTT